MDICLLSSEEWDGKALDMAMDLFPVQLIVSTTWYPYYDWIPFSETGW